MTESIKNNFRDAVQQGLIASVITLSVCAIGMVELFAQRDIVANVLTMGQVLIFAAPAAFSYFAARSAVNGNRRSAMINSLIIGMITSLSLIIMIWITQVFDIRNILFNLSPDLIDLLTFNQGLAVGSFLLLIVMVIVSLGANLFYFIPDKFTRPVFSGLMGTFFIGMLSEILTERVRNFFGADFTKLVFQSKALKPIPAILIFAILTGFSIWRNIRSKSSNDKQSGFAFIENGKIKWVRLGISFAFLLLIPFLLGTYLSEVINNVGIFILMGLGLNIVVGFAGLLDLGYVAFFAIGAYTMAILTSSAHLGIAEMSFWAALPICIIVSGIAGIILGFPVLGMRGDYLAIVTLGFGEIIRLLALSDMLKPYIGGAQGVLRIPKPVFGEPLIEPGKLYYVVLAGVLLAAFVSWRLRDSRLGRQWMAMREDEDVAEAMGINLITTKLLAFGAGAAFSGMAGAIFASKLTSIFPHSFSLMISINVLCLIIVGGIGSLPGVAVGALILVGLPELLREFKEFRLLMYGALLVVMMLTKPEGFLPSEVHKREMHSGEDDFSGAEAD